MGPGAGVPPTPIHLDCVVGIDCGLWHGGTMDRLLEEEGIYLKRTNERSPHRERTPGGDPRIQKYFQIQKVGPDGHLDPKWHTET